ncbi:MAG: ABC transporter ATP-binding protein [Lachnospira sp.]
MKPILSLENVSFSYHTKKGETLALKDISFSVTPGSFTSIVGPSGCGKSTLLSLIYGLVSPESGRIIINPYSDNKNIQIGYMLQKDNLFEWRSVYKNVCLGLELNHKKTPDNIKKIDNMLENYGLAPFKHAKPSQLSGGMRQRAALIRTLALEPELLLLDEPFSALDYQTRLNVSDDIGKIIKEQNKTAILVTHDISEAIAMGDRVIILSKRPAVVRKIVDINLSIPDRTPFLSRSAPEFKEFFNEIWEEMQHET